MPTDVQPDYDWRLGYYREEIARLAPLLGKKVMTHFGPCVLLGIKPLDATEGNADILVQNFLPYRAIVGFERDGEMEVEEFKTKHVEAIE